MTLEEKALFDNATRLIEEASSIAVSGHTDPDGDALGSVLAMVHAIEGRWPGKAVVALLADDRPVPEVYRFLPGADRFVPAASFRGEVDLFIALDTPTRGRLHDSCSVLDRAGASFSFDHHPACEPFIESALVRTQAAACGVIVYDYIRHLDIDLTPAMATCLMTAVVTDTGRFQYQNADPEAFMCAAALLKAGADLPDICLKVYQSKTMAQLKLQKIVLGRLSLACEGDVAYSYILRSDIAPLGIAPQDCDTLVDNVRALAGPKVVLFLREVEPSVFRGNLRAKVPGCDVSAIARRFGGGGHKAAAGFTIEGPVDEAIRRVVGCCGNLVG